ncbi:MAG: hypothetical protein QXZ13_03905 [Candidatus Diapherotrites archaeon]
MQETLNFGLNQKKAVLDLLSKFEEAKVTNYFEEKRVKYKDCTITLYSSGRLSIQGKNASLVKDEFLSMLGLKRELVIGIDEVGRGENFGPLVVCGVLADSNSLLELRDSKKINAIQSKASLVSEKMLASVHVVVNAELLDYLRNSGKTINDVEAIAIDKIAELLSNFADAKIIVDGAPIKTSFTKLFFLPKADDLEPVVGAASVLAKKYRDESKDKKKRMTWNNKNV